MAYHPRQYEVMVKPSIRAVQGTTPKIKVGNQQIARKPRFRGDPSVKFNDIWYAVEFGSSRKLDSRGRRTGQKLPPRKKGGYVLYPTIKSLQKDIVARYVKATKRILKGYLEN
jgi:hypothetical protein